MSTTIKDIAEMAQVSVATVSRVINGNGYVKKETKETIENLLKQTGYTPTARAQKKILQNSGKFHMKPAKSKPLLTTPPEKKQPAPRLSQPLEKLR